MFLQTGLDRANQPDPKGEFSLITRGLALNGNLCLGFGGGRLMPQWMQDLTAGWPVIKANLPTFFVLTVLIIGAVWWVIDWRYGGVLASKTGQIELQDRQLADYRDKLKGATPEEAKAKIDALEQTVNLIIGRKWEPLTKTEIETLASNLSSVPKTRVQIMYENALGRELAQSFYDAFKQAGWEGATLGPGGGLGYGVTTGQGPSSAVALKEAIEKSSKVKVEAQRTNVAEWPGLIFLAVGINAPSPFK